MRLKHFLHTVLTRKSIFYKTLGLLMALMIVTLTIFGVFINRLVVSNQKQNIDDLQLLQLQRISSNVELVFSLLAKNGGGISLAGNSEEDIIQLVGNFNENQELVRNVYWFVPDSNELYYFNESDSLEEYGDGKILDSFRASYEADTDLDWDIILHSRRIFLMPRDKGTNGEVLIIEINRAELYKIVQAENQDFDTTIYVYDSTGLLLFDYMAGGLQPKDFLQDALFLSADQENPDASFYLYISQRLGWKFLTRVNPAHAQISSSDMVAIILPVLLIYILVAVLFSLYITRSIYRPINRLIQITTGANIPKVDGTREAVQNEVDYLELAYRDSIGQNEQYRVLMNNISGDIMEQLLRGILNGTNTSLETINSTLEGIGNGGFAQGRFTVLVVTLDWGEAARPDLVEIGLYRRSTLQMLHQLDPDGQHLISFFIENNTAVSVVHFPSQTPYVQIRQWCGELEQEVSRQVEQLPFQVFLGKGRIYSDITMLQFSYYEALDDMRYLRYMESSGPEELSESSELGYEGQYYLSRVQAIIDGVEKGRRKEADEACASLIDELYSREADSIRCLVTIIDHITERMILLRITQQEMQDAGFSGAVDQLMNDTDIQEQRQRAGFIFSSALQLIEQSIRRSNNRYVLEAKEYIVSHYTDGGLSLGRISEAIGISTPYLSELFTDSTGEGINTYLNHYRIEQAKRLMSETSMNISEIGYKCGFNSAQNFSRVFKKTTGMTPKQYREYSSSGGEG